MLPAKKQGFQVHLLDPLTLDIIDGKVKDGDQLKATLKIDKVVFG